MISSIVRQVCPPIIWNVLLRAKSKFAKTTQQKSVAIDKPKEQDLDLYWDAEYAKVLEEWGKDNTWNEIQLMLASCQGKVLDIACGTGITIKLLEKFDQLEIHGFDISDLLIGKALEKNIPKERLKVADATKTNYAENAFDYSYSIGSLEHFTLEGIDQFLGESARYTKRISYHMIPVSRSGKNEGWLKTVQSFFNNSERWWYDKFKKHYRIVHCIPSKWEDTISYGRWFICIK
jgi:ubiquinone/menaquinone biosynthesis C-methylase UbiE